jgi:predicted  nucleic acid-binding Zn-ribbon protein
MEHLLALQKLELDIKPLTLEHEAEVLKLREQVPAPILGHFDWLIVRGKKGVAIARNGVCSECHLRITSGTLASLVYTTEVQVCGNCGRYLYLPEDEPLGLTDSPPPANAPAKTVAKRTRKKALAHVV